MKKLIALALALVLTLSLLAACGGPLTSPKNGTYRSGGILSQTWTFSGSNNITVTTLGGLVSAKGTYLVSGNTLTMTTSFLGEKTTSSYTITEITSTSFFIDGEKFVKQ